jgi:hypothetical protein
VVGIDGAGNDPPVFYAPSMQTEKVTPEQKRAIGLISCREVIPVLHVSVFDGH